MNDDPIGRLYYISPRAANLVDQLSLTLKSPKGEIVTDAVEMYAILYQTAKALCHDIPSLISFLEELLKSN